MPPFSVRVDGEVADAIGTNRAVVALESTIFSHLGLPGPANAHALAGCLTAIRGHGAVPAITAILDGVPRVGIAEHEHERILGAARKTSEREIAAAIAQRWPFGASTVSAALCLAAHAGIRVFATGGIGGVHRGVQDSGDISADLGAIARYPMVTVCAGAKSFLDLPRTLEHLEMLSVPVVGFGTDEFPAFTMRSSGLPVPVRVDSIAELADLVDAQRALGSTGVLVAVPLPEAQALDATVGQAVLDRALEAAEHAGIRGPAVTPFVLAHIADATGGDAVAANLALAANNAAVAAQLAVALATR
ncbi:MAG TPA: pseudouridine-5'-phosphate glycosidase [Acidimicrobiales bacterium]|nr:pseudouridine-5'-phosphate glycosidase [Acidimicrobiales bacterium]